MFIVFDYSYVRDTTDVNVNIRVGVHTGSVLCGVIGLRRWKYDVWSDDVIIASHTEKAGSFGYDSETNLLCKFLHLAVAHLCRCVSE